VLGLPVSNGKTTAEAELFNRKGSKDSQLK
jgi:hypothetical protein